MKNKLFYPIYLILLVLITLGGVYLLEAPIGIAAGLVLVLGAGVLPVFVKYPEYGVAAMAFLLPFERIPSIEIGGASLKINHFMIIVLALAVLIRAAFNKLSGRRLGPIAIAVLLFFSSLLLSIPVAVNFGRSIKVTAFVLLMMVAFFVVYNVINSKKVLILVLKGLIWGALLASFWGLFQFFGDMIGLPIEATLLKEGYDKSTFGFARVQAFSQEPLYFANYIFIPMFLGAALLLKNQAQRVINKRLMTVLVVTLAINFVLALSRGAYIAGFITLLILIAFQYKKILNLKVMLPVMLSTVVVLTGVYIALLKSESGSIGRFVSHAALGDRGTSESWVSRFDAAGEALTLFKESPIVGVGLGNYGPITQGNPSVTPEGGWFIVNNEYLEILAENGIVGISFFVILIVIVLTRVIKAYRKSKDEFGKAVSLGLGLAFFAIMAQYVTFSTIYIIHVWFLMALISAASQVIIRENERS